MLGSLTRAAAVALAAWAGLAGAQDDVKAIHLRTHSLQPPYLDSQLNSRWWDFGGNTLVRADQYVRLTGEHPSQSGYLFSRVPLTATNWEVEVEFKIHGKGSLFGDGMAIWVTKERGSPGDVFGQRDRFHGLGVFIDTYKNNRPGTIFPYVMAMIGDGQVLYDKQNDGKANELAGCSARGLRNQGIPTKIRIRYYADKELTVELAYRKEDEWTKCFTTGPVSLPSVAYLGFSAETGELADNHDIIKVETRNLYQPGGGAGDANRGSNSRDSGRARFPPNLKDTQPSGFISWIVWLFKFLLIATLLGGVGYVGFTAWRARQRRDRF